jgi:hypothetical protein
MTQLCYRGTKVVHTRMTPLLISEVIQVKAPWPIRSPRVPKTGYITATRLFDHVFRSHRRSMGRIAFVAVVSLVTGQLLKEWPASYL